MTSGPRTSVRQPNGHPSGASAPAPVAHGWLRDYEATKFELAALIREASSVAWRAEREALQRDLRALLQQLAEDRFYLTLAGQFNRGKTTLMNAMLGMDRLPTGVVPVTSVITAVSYNTRERIVMHFENSQLTHEVALADLRQWITEDGNPGNAKRIDMAEVQLPAELLRRGAFFVDTPGLGSAVIENTATTHRFLPWIDALVLVTSFEFPLSQEEMVFLRRALALRRKVFIAVNKLDLRSPSQQTEVLEFVRRQLAEEERADGVPLFAVSASEGLAAKIEHDKEKLEKSGLPAFEQALVNYLVNDRYGDFLEGICRRLEGFLSVDGMPELRELQVRLEDIRGRALHASEGEAPSGEAAEADAGPSVKIASCSVCKRMADATFKFMSQFQYELSHGRDAQIAHASRSGFCSLHTREYARLASPQGIASGYPLTLLSVARHLRSLSQEGRLLQEWRDEFNRFAPSTNNCRACDVIALAEKAAIKDFLRRYEELLLDQSNDLPCACVRHLYCALSEIGDREVANSLLLHSAIALERTAENMERLALRHGGLHMELATDEELGSPEKGLNLLVGQPNVRPAGSA